MKRKCGQWHNQWIHKEQLKQRKYHFIDTVCVANKQCLCVPCTVRRDKAMHAPRLHSIYLYFPDRFHLFIFLNPGNTITMVFSSTKSPNDGSFWPSPLDIFADISQTTGIFVCILHTPSTCRQYHTPSTCRQYHTPSTCRQSHSFNMLNISSSNMPPISHSFNMPLISHSFNMPSISHSFNMPPILHSFNMPSISHSSNMPPISHSFNMPLISHSFNMPSISHFQQLLQQSTCRQCHTPSSCR